ncbi:MAG TPA: B12-binding domain-containing radical SAM protein [Candidatus Limiplasma sp.]|nr:B12-binding domain-containing radical SAM protein [Candidatus Limiplasma sp.]HRX07626.1 B12-binding domain-containing radical SAM protein [Candidatus Limiplasma sp.]
MLKRDYKTALIAVNAQYIHTGLGVRSIAAYVRRETEHTIDLMEFTINNTEQDVLTALFDSRADAYLFSCYIWNIEFILRTVRNLRQLLPDVCIGLGGPQVAYQGKAILAAEPAVDLVITGEGEETVCQLLGLLNNNEPLQSCSGIVYRQDGQVISTAARAPLPLDALAFAYPDLDQLQHRIVYYESMRGCPFSCSYCSSSIEHGVRKRSLPLVFADLSVFLTHGVPQVKFVDRTFNCDKAHALGIWKWLAAHDNGVTNFHFELSGELLDEETLAFLAGVRPLLFQFEIGVQSTNPQTLQETDRPANLPKLFIAVRRLLGPGNIHVHLDLIAGLPYEEYTRFQTSFNDVYACKPHQLQLGFLKVLPGSHMQQQAETYGLLYTNNAPYEVLQNRWISYPQLVLLHGVAHMVNIYYNSYRFQHIIAHLVALFPDAFSFYLALWQHYQTVTQGKPLSEMGYYSLLESFMQAQGFEATEQMQWLAKFDLLLHGKPKKLPPWITADVSHTYRDAIQGFFKKPDNIKNYLPEYAADSSTRVERTAHLEIFPFNPATGEDGAVAIVFNYRRRSIAGVARFHVLPLKTLVP